ncbi:MAG: FIST C-terminal domain-containing protein [Deferribacteraceae bacterium]|jgi:hypothetical protein|nr:FIST C-terminal domain-containing protein [Deferribacteraceae bacterium]
MVKLLTAHTTEVDDELLALEEISQRLDLRKNRRKNSIALIFRHKYFSNESFFRKLEAFLSMKVITITTILSSTNDAYGGISLSVSVLTSDTAEFATGISESSDPADLYTQTAAKTALSPKAIFVFSTIYYTFSGSEQVRILSETSGNLPIFGSVSCTLPHSENDDSIYYDGTFHAGCLVIILLCGDFKASFSSLTSPINKFLVRNIEVTKTEKNILKELDGKPAATFLREAGVIHDGIDALSLLSLPLCSEKGGKVSHIWIMDTVHDNGDIVCHTDISEGKTISVGLMEQNHILNSVTKFLEENIEGKNKNFIIFSCAVRSIALGFNYDAEVAFVSQKTNTPYLFAYSGGEYCPTSHGNNFLTASIVSCGFEES